MLSRPCLLLRTRPALCMTLRCLVMACRVTLEPVANRVMDMGPSSQSRSTRRKRVWSPSAAKMGAASLLSLGKVCLDQRHLYGPALLIARECLGAARERDLVEAGFSESQHHPVRQLL